MSWLSHFTGWVGEKKNAILPIVTGLAGFAAGMLPGVGGALSKQVDKWGSKISGASDALQGLGGGAASPNSPAVTAVEPASAPTTSLDAAQRPAPASSGPSPILIGGGILLAALLLGGSNRR